MAGPRRGEASRAAARFASNRWALAGLVILVLIVAAVLLPGLVTRYDPIEMDMSSSLQPPLLQARLRALTAGVLPWRRG